ncbi:SMI1-KNR4 cell-wall [Clostridium cavendishii DSM 21758]|uniref:SMI1-KNR4 cell-wall n=1 Tax=Clostridium cavendishii DSM 21758 TaxID=1121302 RepID=A0A1M6D5W1_9CLOT|nr:SMI1/KNR4 family protein [Clostridium cavendishii]SHI68607.1 SMI1-KNR4 cell-wall [Clostridium cavendishii DSM 21758]
MKANFYNEYFDELNAEQLAILKEQDITKENMNQYSYIADEEGNIETIITDEMIYNIIKELGINELPKSYIKYLKIYGDGGWGKIWIYGIYKWKQPVESRLLDSTLMYRKKYNLKNEFVCIAIGSGNDDIIYFFDTSRMCNGECPVVVFNERTTVFEEYAKNFNDFVRKYIKDGIGWQIRINREIIHMIRTPKIPFVQSRASFPVLAITTIAIAIVTNIPYTAFGKLMGMSPMPVVYFLWLVVTILAYMLLVTLLKKLYIKIYGQFL